MKLFITIYLLAAFSSISFSEDKLIDVTIKVNNIQSGEGPIHIALVDDMKDFPQVLNPKIKKIIPANMNTISYVFKNIKAKKYAISAFQDLDNDNALAKGVFGPKEPYALSGNPGFGKPKFKDCAIDLNDNQTIEMTLSN